MRVIAPAGCTLDHTRRVTVWLDDARDFGSFNRVYLEQVPRGKPAHSTTQEPPTVDAKVDIDVVAYHPGVRA